jgi:hypothetical protein
MSLLCGPPIAAALMERHISTPFIAVGFIIALRIVLLLIIPETLALIPSRPHPPSSTLDSRSALHQDTATNSQVPRGLDVTHEQKSSMKRIRKSIMSIATEVHGMLQKPGLGIVCFSFFIKRIAFSCEGFIPQFASLQLHSKLKDTVWLQIFQTTGAIIATTCILPMISRYLRPHCLRVTSWDWVLVRGSICSLIVGFSLFWTTRHVWSMLAAMLLCGLGEGLEPALQALALSLVGSGGTAQLFSLIGTLDALAKLVGGPVMAWTFSIARPDGSPGGYCFLLAAVRPSMPM